MVCIWVACHEIDGNHENDEDNSDSHKQGVECWISGNLGEANLQKNNANKFYHIILGFSICRVTMRKPVASIYLARIFGRISARIFCIQGTQNYLPPPPESKIELWVPKSTVDIQILENTGQAYLP